MEVKVIKPKMKTPLKYPKTNDAKTHPSDDTGT